MPAQGGKGKRRTARCTDGGTKKEKGEVQECIKNAKPAPIMTPTSTINRVVGVSMVKTTKGARTNDHD